MVPGPEPSEPIRPPRPSLPTVKWGQDSALVEDWPPLLYQYRDVGSAEPLVLRL